MHRKVISLILSVLLVICSALPAQAAVSDTGFADVSASAWYVEAVTYCRDNGLMSGTGNNNFSPDSTANRAMLVSVLYRQAGSPAVTSTSNFTDVPANAYYKTAVDWGASTGLVSGYGSGRFGSNDPVTRQDLASFLWRAEGRPTPGQTQAFADANLIADYAVSAVNWAREKGIISGKGGNRFDPRGHATRAEMAAMLMRWVQGKGETPSPAPGQGKTLIAYFSCTNNTENIANHIKSALPGADLYEITPQQPYTSADLNYNNSDSRANREQNDPAARPAISGSVSDMSQYDVVFIGYPIWWGQAPKIISTFLESYDFSGKTIIPFCTSGSSPIGSSATNLHSLAPSAGWKDGRRFSGSAAQADVQGWVNSHSF